MHSPLFASVAALGFVLFDSPIIVAQFLQDAFRVPSNGTKLMSFLVLAIPQGLPFPLEVAAPAQFRTPALFLSHRFAPA